jgi:hypothetical protein
MVAPMVEASDFARPSLRVGRYAGFSLSVPMESGRSSTAKTRLLTCTCTS